MCNHSSWVGANEELKEGSRAGETIQAGLAQMKTEASHRINDCSQNHTFAKCSKLVAGLRKLGAASLLSCFLHDREQLQGHLFFKRTLKEELISAPRCLNLSKSKMKHIKGGGGRKMSTKAQRWFLNQPTEKCPRTNNFMFLQHQKQNCEFEVGAGGTRSELQVINVVQRPSTVWESVQVFFHDSYQHIHSYLLPLRLMHRHFIWPMPTNW